MFVILLFSLISHAALREHDIDPGPRSLCRRAEMNSCIKSHNSARIATLSAIAGVDDKINILQKDRHAISIESSALENQIRNAQTTAQMADRERVETGFSSSKEAIFSGGPRAEEIFFLRGEQNSWDETYPADRRARLNTLAKSSRELAAKLEPLRQNLAMEIAALDVLNASLLQERAQRGQQVNVHADMCESGCRMQFCRDE